MGILVNIKINVIFIPDLIVNDNFQTETLCIHNECQLLNNPANLYIAIVDKVSGFGYANSFCVLNDYIKPIQCDIHQTLKCLQEINSIAVCQESRL